MVVRAFLLFFTLLLSAGSAVAQDYPSRPIRIEVGFAAGGGTDLLARVLADEMTKRLGQRVVIENKPGASGALAGGVVARSAPDGYTLWIGTQGAMAVAPLIQSPPPFDPIADFQPVARLTTVSQLITVTESFPAKDFKEFVDLIKANPGKYSYATAGLGGPSHLTAELFSGETGLQMQHIPYAGDGAAVADVLSGVVPIWFVSPASSGQYLASKKVRALVVLANARVPSLPDTPTIGEFGYGSAAVEAYAALLAPKGTPPEVVVKLNQVLAEIYKDPEALARIEKIGYVPRYGDAKVLADLIVSDNNLWRDIVLRIIKPQVK